jgi:hypothetical protein
MEQIKEVMRQMIDVSEVDGYGTEGIFEKSPKRYKTNFNDNTIVVIGSHQSKDWRQW